MHCRYIKGLDSMDCPFLLVITSPLETAVFVVITVNRPLSYLGKSFHRLYILPCRYRCTIHEYWSSWHCCHIQVKKYYILQRLKQQTYWLMKKLLKGINSGPNMWREDYPVFRGISHFSLKIYPFFSVSYQFKSHGSVIIYNFVLFFVSTGLGGLLSNYSITFRG